MEEKFSRKSELPSDPMLLTVKHLQSNDLKPADKPYDRLVGDGLVLRVMPSGSISFRYAYKHEGKQRVVTIGLYPKKTLKKLRAEYVLLSERVEDGEDVREERVKKKQARRSQADKDRAEKARKRNVLNVEGLSDLFIKYIENPNSTNKRGRPYSKKTILEYRSHLLNHIVPEFGAIPVDELKRKEIAIWLEKKAVKAPSQANHLLSTFGAVFSWATKKELMDVNLVAGMEKPAGKQQSKDRALDYDNDLQEIIDKGEIREFWDGLENVNPLHRTSLRLVLMTALRPGEVLGARWDSILADKWVIPVSATKSKKDAHKIPLTPDLKKMLKELREITGNTPYLFPQSRLDDGVLRLVKNGRTGKYEPTETSTVSKIIRSKDYTPHDLRRTVATHIKALGFLEAEIGMLLHHTNDSVTAIYAQGDDMKRKRKMLDAWQRQLKQILAGKTSNVVSMR